MLRIGDLRDAVGSVGVSDLSVTWRAALEQVSPIADDELKFKTYLFPPIWKIVNPLDLLKTSKCIFNIIRIINFLPALAKGRYSLKLGGLTVQDWNYILNRDYTRTANLGSFAPKDLLSLDAGLPSKSNESANGRPVKQARIEGNSSSNNIATLKQD